MDYYIIILFLIGLAFMESVFKYNRLRSVFYLFASILFIIIQCYNTWSPDLEAYKIHFLLSQEDYIRSSSEPFHIFLIDTVKSFNGSFDNFFFIYGALIMFFFLIAIYKYTKFPVFVLLVFFIIPFYPNITQIRFFLSFAIFLFSIQYFEKRKIIFYLLYIFSVLSHYSMLIFIVFFLIKNLETYAYQKKSNLIILISVCLLSLVPRQISEPLIVFLNPKYAMYLDSTYTFTGTILLFLPFFILNNFVIYHYNKYFKELSVNIEEKYVKNIPIIIKLIYFANYLIIAQYFIRDFSRITMNLTILSYLYLSLIIYYGWTKNYKIIQSIFIRIFLFIYVITTFYINFLMLNSGTYMDSVLKTINSNSFYEIFK